MPKKVLVGVLDWGLGHATRCVPLLHYLSQLECQIFIAATGSSRALLEQEIPHAAFLSPPPYAVKYKGKGNRLMLSLLAQTPRLLAVVQQEKRWLQHMHRRYGFDLLISDNRYGLCLSEIPSVILTHQLLPRTGGVPIPAAWIRKLHYRFLERFREVWVPDVPEKPGLAGELSHPALLPARCRYIGPLSRLDPTAPASSLDEGYLLVLLSGPEPARTQFESILRSQLRNYKGSWKMVLGKPGSNSAEQEGVYNHVDATGLSALISGASLVISRPGYTSVMDLIRLGRKAVFVPTPGQTEQEYLAEHLEAMHYFPWLRQEEFGIGKAVQLAESFRFSLPDVDFGRHRHILEEFVK